MKRVVCFALLLVIVLCGCGTSTTAEPSKTDPSSIGSLPAQQTEGVTQNTEAADPIPSGTVPTEPDSTQPVATAPTETEPKPTSPRPTEPTPTEPTPTKPQPTEPKPTEPKPTEPKPTEPKPTEPAPTEPTPTEPVSHSDLYIPGVSVEDVIRYFNEVSLDAEYVNGGDPSKLQKWSSRITYIIYGEPTDEDRATLSRFTQWLNGIYGFPGIRETTVPAEANLKIYFCTADEMINILGSNFRGDDAGVTFWYDGSNQIYNANICYRTDLNQYLRNSVILEEIYNGLGPVQDTSLRSDSIIFSGFSQPQSLTSVDKLILRLLYHPQMKCGMNAKQCEEVIRSLYY